MSRAVSRPSSDPDDPARSLLIDCGAFLRNIRIERGMTQYQVAHAADGIDQARVSRAEAGKSLGAQIQVARLFGLEFWEVAKGAAEQVGDAPAGERVA